MGPRSGLRRRDAGRNHSSKQRLRANGGGVISGRWVLRLRLSTPRRPPCASNIQGREDMTKIVCGTQALGPAGQKASGSAVQGLGQARETSCFDFKVGLSLNIVSN